MPLRRATWLALALLCLWAAAPVESRAAAGGADDDDGPASQSGPAAPRRSDGYSIVLTRPMKVGQSYAWVADATVVETIPGPPSAAGSSTINQTVSVHLDGVVQILAVDAEGEVTEMACTVNECTARSGKERKFVVQPGRVILVEAGKSKSKLTATSGNLTLQDEPLLSAVLSVPRLGEPSDDEVFGT